MNDAKRVPKQALPRRNAHAHILLTCRFSRLSEASVHHRSGVTVELSPHTLFADTAVNLCVTFADESKVWHE